MLNVQNKHPLFFFLFFSYPTPVRIFQALYVIFIPWFWFLSRIFSCGWKWGRELSQKHVKREKKLLSVFPVKNEDFSYTREIFHRFRSRTWAVFKEQWMPTNGVLILISFFFRIVTYDCTDAMQSKWIMDKLCSLIK